MKYSPENMVLCGKNEQHFNYLLETLTKDNNDLLIHCSNGKVTCNRVLMSLFSELIRTMHLPSEDLVICLPHIKVEEITCLIENIATQNIVPENESLLKLLSIKPPLIEPDSRELADFVNQHLTMDLLWTKSEQPRNRNYKNRNMNNKVLKRNKKKCNEVPENILQDPDYKIDKFIHETNNGLYSCKFEDCSYTNKKKILLKYHVLVHLKQKQKREKRREILSTIEGNQEESNGLEIDNSGFYSNVDTNDETLENNLTKKFDVKVEPEIITNKVESSKLSILEKATSKRKKKIKKDISTDMKNKSEEYVFHDKEAKEYTCIYQKCGYKSRSKVNVDNHVVMKHLRKKLFSCDECEQNFATAKLLKKHVSQEHLSEEMRIAFNSWIIVTKDPTGQSLYKCSFPQCSFTGPSKKSAGLHALSAHTEKSFICHQCGDSFLTESSLVHHTKYKHKNDQKVDGLTNQQLMYQCEFCKKQFKTLSYLAAHENEHKGVRPFQCDACGKSFGSAGMLRSHKFTHAPRIFKCDCCDQSFPRRNTLLVHLRAVHMQEKPYECDICGQRFPRSSSMTRHRRIHTGLPSYQCQYCHKTTTQRGDLNRHIAKMHAWARHSGDQEQVSAVAGQDRHQESNLPDLPPSEDKDNHLESIAAPVEEHTYVVTHVENVFFQRK